MRFVPIKSQERQAACMLMTVRERLVSVKSQLSNAFRSYAVQKKRSAVHVFAENDIDAFSPEALDDRRKGGDGAGVRE
jgi:transposase